MRVDKPSAFPWPLVLLMAVSNPPLAVETYPSHEQALETGGNAVLPHADTPSQTRFARDQWGLDETEWQRYQTLMRGIRGSISPAHLSPIEVLGIHARDPKERADYAKRWARLMKEDAERILAFQRDYSHAWRELNPDGRFVEPAGPPDEKAGRTRQVRPGDRLLLFVRLRDCADCEARLRSALRAQGRAQAHLDIYVVGDVGDADIRAWAGRNQIDPAAVRGRTITLNHEHGELAQLAGVAATVPTLVRMRKGTATVLDEAIP